MSNGVFYCSFKLNEGAVVADFLAAAKKLNDGYISKQKGYISWKQLADGDTWADFIIFESMEDVKKFEADAGNASDLAGAFYSFIDMESCDVKYYTIERDYN